MHNKNSLKSYQSLEIRHRQVDWCQLSGRIASLLCVNTLQKWLSWLQWQIVKASGELVTCTDRETDWQWCRSGLISAV